MLFECGFLVFVINARGEREEFDEGKVLRTCIRAGADRATAEEIAHKVASRVRDGMHTQHILKMTLGLLDKIGKPEIAAKYDLKGAMMRLGPAGFAFENFFAEVMQEIGYATKVRQIVQGLCLTHEVDIVAETKDQERFMVECKYRNYAGDYVGVKDALYTYARFIDLTEGHIAGKCPRFDGVWLVTNTKFSSDVEEYARCKGMKIMGWKQPKDASLSELIESKKLYPITVLRLIDNFAQKKLASAGLLLCRDIAQMSPEQLRNLTGIAKKKASTIVDEALKVCGVE